MLKDKARSVVVITGSLLILIVSASGMSNLMSVRAAAPSPVGSWLVVPNGGGAARTNLLTLTSDGLIVWAGGIATLTGGRGAWVRTGDHTVAFTFLTIRHNPAGDYVGLAKSRGTITFDEGFERLAGSIQVDSSDVQGKIVGSVKFTSRGTRIHVEAL